MSPNFNSKGGIMKKYETAIILAGGKSSRMGFDKQFLTFNNKKIIDTIIEQLEKEFQEIIIVTNKPEEYKNYSQKIFTDEIINKGPLGGIYTGLKKSTSNYAFITACDMPNINLDYIQYMKEIIEKNLVDICITKIGDNIEPFHGFYSKEIVEDIKEYLFLGRRDIKGLVKELNTYYISERIFKKYNPDLSIFINLNTQEDLNGIIKTFGGIK